MSDYHPPNQSTKPKLLKSTISLKQTAYHVQKCTFFNLIVLNLNRQQQRGDTILSHNCRMVLVTNTLVFLSPAQLPWSGTLNLSGLRKSSSSLPTLMER